MEKKKKKVKEKICIYRDSRKKKKQKVYAVLLLFEGRMCISGLACSVEWAFIRLLCCCIHAGYNGCMDYSNDFILINETQVTNRASSYVTIYC